MRKLGVFAIVLSLCFLILGIWFWFTYSMRSAQSFTVGSQPQAQSILIALQGSVYKNAIAEIIVEHFSNHDIYLQGMDVKHLDKINPKNWSVICILNTWEIGQSPTVVTHFIDNHPTMTNHVVLTTSFDGKSQLKNLDGFTSESVLIDTERDSEQLISEIERILFP